MNKLAYETILNKHIDRTSAKQADKVIWTYEIDFGNNNVKMTLNKN